jgi:hypothetical protein
MHKGHVCGGILHRPPSLYVKKGPGFCMCFYSFSRRLTEMSRNAKTKKYFYNLHNLCHKPSSFIYRRSSYMAKHIKMKVICFARMTHGFLLNCPMDRWNIDLRIVVNYDLQIMTNYIFLMSLCAWRICLMTLTDCPIPVWDKGRWEGRWPPNI